jgi:hypothetical protein
MILTYQDFLESQNDVKGFIAKAINQHTSSEMYKTAVDADNYDRQKNTTIYNYVRTIMTSTGATVEDFTAANNRIASNFFHRLNTQRCMYSLGNGVSFSEHKEKVLVDGVEQTVDQTKELLSVDFDTALKDLAYKALIHGVSFGFWNFDRLYVFPLTEFVPLWDEDTGALMAGIRFWQLDADKPMTAVLYEVDGYTKYKGGRHSGSLNFDVAQEKRAYKQVYRVSEADGAEVVGGENYGALPIVPLWGSKLHQSTLVGMQRSIDSYDLIRSGFANDLTDCAQIYWILSNCSGMTEPELARFRDRLKIQHIAVADTDNSGVTPYTQEIPFQARQTYLDSIRAGIYEDFGGLDVHTVAAGATNDHIDAAYQPLDENADDFEFQIIKFVQQVLALIGIEDTPVFKRNRISNQMEQTQMVMLEAQYLDEETLLQKLPNITVDEIPGILARRVMDNASRFKIDDGEDETEDSASETEEMQ